MVALPDMGETDTEHLLKEAGVDGETIAALGGAGGGGVSAPASASDALAQARDLVGKEQYHEVGEFPVERGYVWTSCASVENGNPLFWDDGGGRRAHRRADRATFHGLGVVPAAPLGTGAYWSRRCRCRCTST